MKTSDVVAVKRADGFHALPRLLGFWREAGATQGPREAIIIADGTGRPLPSFLGLWRGSLLIRPPYPHDVLFTDAGNPTETLVRIWRG